MPSSITHSYFVLDAYEKSKLNNLNTEYLKVFSQGPDFYYFYHWLINKNKDKYYQIGRSMHKTEVFNYFYEMINYINNNNLYHEEQIKEYLYGHLCHYILDSYTHPFIFYKTGVFKKKDKTTYKYNSKHADMEFYLDTYFIHKRENINPKNYKTYKKLFNINEFNMPLKDMINHLMKNIYNYNNCSKIYLKGIKRTKLFFHLFCYDKLGIKKNIYKTIDKITPSFITKITPLSYHVNPSSKLYYLNNEKKFWNHPCNNEEMSNNSFIELYLKALDKSTTIINEVDKMLESGTINKSKLEKLINNNSYLTGKNCEEKNKIKYFEY